MAPLSRRTSLFSSSSLRIRKETYPLLKRGWYSTPVHTALVRTGHMATPNYVGSWEMLLLAEQPLVSLSGFLNLDIVVIAD